MTWDDKVLWLLFGMTLGFLFGYIVRYLQEIKAELDDVDRMVRGDKPKERGDGGFFVPSRATLVNIALGLVVFMVAYAAFESQASSNGVERNQSKIQNTAECNTEFLDETIAALNVRTTFVRSQADANISLQAAQTEYLNTLLQKDTDRVRARRALNSYVDSLRVYINTTNDLQQNYKDFPYPTTRELSDCYSKEE